MDDGIAWLSELYDQHGVALYGFALNLTRSVPEAEEVVQEVFLKVARERKRFSFLENPRSYLLRMGHRLVVDRFRKGRSRERNEEGFSAEAEWLFLSDPGAGEDGAFFRAKISKALAILPLEQRAVVHLKVWEGKTFEDIAALLEIPSNTAASRYRYGIDKLRGLLRSIQGEWNGTL
jgi:RNA polymerase sigma-70 factor (ECF subfamily)